jgi:diacylglycerol kinase family enzyme
LALLKIFQKFPFHSVKLFLNGKETNRETPMLFIGNGRYNYHGFDIGERRLPVDGKLSLFILKDIKRWDLLKFSIHAMSDKIHNHPNFESHLVEEAVIELPKKFIYVSKDGEVLRMESPLRYSIKPKALKVIVPK